VGSTPAPPCRRRCSHVAMKSVFGTRSRFDLEELAVFVDPDLDVDLGGDGQRSILVAVDANESSLAPRRTRPDLLGGKGCGSWCSISTRWVRSHRRQMASTRCVSPMPRPLVPCGARWIARRSRLASTLCG